LVGLILRPIERRDELPVLAAEPLLSTLLRGSAKSRQWADTPKRVVVMISMRLDRVDSTVATWRCNLCDDCVFGVHVDG